MTRLAAKELHDRSRYEPVWAISHADVASALRPYMLARSWVSGVYVAANLAALGVVAVAWSRSDLPGFDAFANACLGMCLVESHSVYCRTGGRPG